MRKVFCIGYHKTGTTSLADALKVLGYNVTGPNWIDRYDLGKNVEKLARQEIEKFDAFQDNPWPILFRELYEWHPDAKFILTTREPEKWIKSVCNHFGGKSSPMREWIYGEEFGDPSLHQQHYLDTYQKHNDDVLAFFQDKPESLLTIDITKDSGWEKLCAFLDAPEPSQAFPHSNIQGKDTKKLVSRLKKFKSIVTGYFHR